MLSTAAFNGLLKTLEEPPPYVKFIFATTEIRKVPVTILSRCMRFDLRRVPPETMIDHLVEILGKEGIGYEPEALAMIVRAGEGCVRDCQSLLDQAISHGDGTVTAATVKAMLGLGDRARTIDLFEALMGGDTAGALDHPARTLRRRCRPADARRRPLRLHPSRHPHQGRPGRRRRCLADAGRADPWCRARRPAWACGR